MPNDLITPLVLIGMAIVLGVGAWGSYRINKKIADDTIGEEE